MLKAAAFGASFFCSFGGGFCSGELFPEPGIKRDLLLRHFALWDLRTEPETVFCFAPCNQRSLLVAQTGIL